MQEISLLFQVSKATVPRLGSETAWPRGGPAKHNKEHFDFLKKIQQRLLDTVKITQQPFGNVFLQSWFFNSCYDKSKYHKTTSV